MRKLFMSYSSLLQLINRGFISHADMAHGVYMFNCNRQLVVKPEPPKGEDLAIWRQRYAQAHSFFLPHFLKAEKEGRVVMLTKPNGTYRCAHLDFNKMLKKLGIPELEFVNGQSIPANNVAADALFQELGLQMAPVYITRTVE